MEYLLSQIWLCLALVALIAGLTGWFLRGGSKAKIKALKEEWKVKLARAQNERDYYASEVKSLSAMAEEREEAERHYQSEKQALSIQMEDMRTESEMTAEAFKDQEHVLKKQASELEASNRALLASSEKQQQFQQKFMDSETRAEKISVALSAAEEKISDLQTELDSTKIQLLDTTDKLSITEGLLAERRNLPTQEKTILLVNDKDKTDQSTTATTTHATPSPSPIQTSREDNINNMVLGVGSLLSTPTSSVEVVDAHNKVPHDADRSRDKEKQAETLLDELAQLDKETNASTASNIARDNLDLIEKQTNTPHVADSGSDHNEPVATVDTKNTTTAEQALDNAFSDQMNQDKTIVTRVDTRNDANKRIQDDQNNHTKSAEQHDKNDKTNNANNANNDSAEQIQHKSKSATLAGAGAAALGMAGKMKDKLTQTKDNLWDKVDFVSDVYAIQDIHTISNESAKYLRRMNVISTEDLVDKCASQEGVELIAKSMGKESWVVRSWASMADLMRVKGVDAVNAELLELSGISSVQALASAKIQRLTDSIKVIHKHVGKTNHVPDYDEIETWVKYAKDLPKRLDDYLDKL